MTISISHIQQLPLIFIYIHILIKAFRCLRSQFLFSSYHKAIHVFPYNLYSITQPLRYIHSKFHALSSMLSCHSYISTHIHRYTQLDVMICTHNHILPIPSERHIHISLHSKHIFPHPFTNTQQLTLLDFLLYK